MTHLRALEARLAGTRGILFLFVLLAAFGLRVWLLDGQSLWGDEAISLGRASGTLLEIAQDARHEGTLPPLYYYVLHFWIQVAGVTEFSLRFPSVLAGTAAVAALFAALRPAGARAALAAAGLAAVSQFWVYYGQETRMYAQATFLATLSVAIFVRLVGGRRRAPGWWVLYVAVSAAAVLTHYFTGFVLLAQNAIVGALLGAGWLRTRLPAAGGIATPRRDLRRCFLTWSLAQIAILLLLAPWVVFARDSLGVTAGAVTRAGIALPDIVRHLVLTFSAGPAGDPTIAGVCGLVFAALGLAGLLLRPSFAWQWLVLLAAPVLSIYLVSFTPQTGWARYFIMASPAWYALAALGLDALFALRPGRAAAIIRFSGGVAAALAVAVLAAGSVTALGAYYTQPEHARPDWRSAIHRVETTRADAAVVVNGPPWLPEFDYYFTGAIPRFNLPRPGLADRADMEDELRVAAGTNRGLWLVKYYPPDFDRDGIVERWLAEHAHRTSGEWVENATFSYYSLPGIQAAAPVKVGARFGDAIVLESAAVSRVAEPAGEILQVTLQWRALSVPAQDYVVFVHAVDAAGQLLAQRDSPPVSGYRPSSAWDPGDEVRDRLGVRLPPSWQGGELVLRIGLYSPQDGRRLAVSGAPAGSGSDYLALPVP